MNCMKQLILFLQSVVFLVCMSGQAAAKSNSMNGYVYDDFRDFTQKWRLVTTRYRKDSGEMRFTYANEQAWQHLKEGGVNYPDGAIFGKVSFYTDQDIEFPSSVVPTMPSRMQFMVRNQERHKDTGGWGYVIFSPKGDRLPGDMKQKSVACYVCHKLVSDRGDVFSQILGQKLTPYFSVNFSRSKLDFKSGKRNRAPAEMRDLVPSQMQTISYLQGDLTKNLFYGTLDEIRPALARETIRTKKPAALVEHKGSRFSVTIPVMDSKKCADSEMHIIAHHTVPSKKKPIIKVEFCEKI